MTTLSPPGYRIAGRMSKDDLTVVGTESQFAQSINKLFQATRPKRMIETGTYRGQGTTTAIAAALRDLDIERATFHSVEINAKHVRRAAQNLATSGLATFVTLHHGLSVPRALLPTIEQIDDNLVRRVEADQLVVDHEEPDRAKLYFAETDFPDVPDDLLGKLLAGFDNRPDFVLLDSAGHMGFVEFSYVIETVAKPCYIALDDIHHVKHHRSFTQLLQDSRFRIIASGDEKFGFCIARFEPN